MVKIHSLRVQACVVACATLGVGGGCHYGPCGGRHNPHMGATTVCGRRHMKCGLPHVCDFMCALTIIFNGILVYQHNI